MLLENIPNEWKALVPIWNCSDNYISMLIPEVALLLFLKTLLILKTSGNFIKFGKCYTPNMKWFSKVWWIWNLMKLHHAPLNIWLDTLAHQKLFFHSFFVTKDFFSLHNRVKWKPKDIDFGCSKCVPNSIAIKHIF